MIKAKITALTVINTQTSQPHIFPQWNQKKYKLKYFTLATNILAETFDKLYHEKHIQIFTHLDFTSKRCSIHQNLFGNTTTNNTSRKPKCDGSHEDTGIFVSVGSFSLHCDLHQ